MAAPVKHAVSWWQFIPGWFGIETRAWCGKKVLVRGWRTPDAAKCRECLRAVRGETHG